MVKLKNKDEIKYLKKILEKVSEINVKADHIITVFRGRYYTPFNCPYAKFKLRNGSNNNNNYNNNNGK